MRPRLPTSWIFCVTLGCSRTRADARSCSGNSGRSWGSPRQRGKDGGVLGLPPRKEVPVLEIEDQIAVVVILDAPTVAHELDFLRHVGLQQDPGGRQIVFGQ